MTAEIYGHPPAPETPGATPPAPPEAAPEASRAEMESSVLDALRPLLRGKRRKGGSETEGRDQAGEPAGLEPASSEANEDKGEDAHLGLSPLLEDDGLPLGLGRDPEPLDDEFETFAAIGEDLERRSRRSATMVRLLEQHRQQLLTAERERDAAYEQLARVVPVVQETAQTLREAMDARKVEDDTARMHKLFMLNGRALDELEKVATTLFADFLWVKSAWEQYARSVEEARKLRSGIED